jgi:hypothetical protein
VQEELLAPLRELPPQFSEPFTITVVNTYFGPIAFVHFQSTTKHESPSTAVVIVREYLKREVSRTTNPIFFEVLGPSPFHANFSLTPPSGAIQTAEFGRAGFLLRITPQRGYDRVDFQYLSSRFSTEDQAFNSLRHELFDDLGLYYLIVALDVQEMHEWPRTAERFTALLEMSSTIGFWVEVRTFFKCQKLLRTVFVSLTNFELLRANNESRIRSAYKGVVESGIRPFLRSYIDRVIGDRNTYPTAQVRALVEFLERRYMKTWEVTILALASLIGVMLGTALFAR